MPTITITITVPEGAAVSVGDPSGTPVSKLSIAANVCPDHNVPWHYVPAGVSQRTGQSYRAFWSCPEMGCKKRPPQGWKPPVSAAPRDVTPGDDFDWTFDEPA